MSRRGWSGLAPFELSRRLRPQHAHSRRVLCLDRGAAGPLGVPSGARLGRDGVQPGVWGPIVKPRGASRIPTALAAVAAFCVLSVPAHAQESRRAVADAVSITERGSCLTHEAVAANVQGWLGSPTVPGELSILVDLPGADGRGDVAFVVLRGREPIARRSFTGMPARCADRRAVLGLAIAIAIDATLLRALGVAAPTEQPVEARSASRPPVVARPTVERHTAPRGERARDDGGAGAGEAESGLRIATGAQLGVTLGSLPEPAVIAGAAVEVSRAPIALRLGTRGTTVVDVPLGRGVVEAQLASASLDACLFRWVAFAEAVSCVGAAGGRLDAQGRGYIRPHAAQMWWLAATTAIGLRAPHLGALRGSVRLEGHWSLVRPRLEVHDGTGQVIAARSTPLLGAALVAEISVVFW